MNPLDNLYTQYADNVENPAVPAKLEHFIPAALASEAVFGATGLTKTPGQGVIPVGANSNGDTVYSHPQLSNNKDITMGQQLTTVTGGALGAMGAFADHMEANKFFSIGAHASDPNLHATLDDHKNNQDIPAFVSAIKNMSDADLAPHKVDYTAYRLYNNWGNMSPGQKSMALASTGLQGYTFQDGNTFDTKTITPSVLGVPAMDAGEAVGLAAKGLNMSPVTKNWDQLAAIQKTQYEPQSATDVATTAHNLNLLGVGQDGAAVNTTSDALSKIGAVPTPHYGVGAVSTPTGSPMIPGYTAIGKVNSKNILVPAANGASASAMNTPDVATRAAYQVYKNWEVPDGGAKQQQGVIGGSALTGGLSSMASSNPYTLGAVATHATFSNVAPTSTDDLGHVMQMGGVTLNRLVDGKVDTETDQKGLGYTVTPIGNSLSNKDMTNQFNTKLSPEEEKNYQSWIQDLSTKNNRDVSKDTFNYDMRGAFKGGEAQTDNGHFTDKYKKPNHPTFSNESQYNGATLPDGSKAIGGSWKGETFIPPKNNVSTTMNPVNYNTIVTALRAAYSQNGVPSKEVGYQLANQAYAEGRLNDSQHAAALQSMNMIFDPTGYTQAQKLLTGKQKGLDLAEQSRNG